MKMIEFMDPDLLRSQLEALGPEVLASFIADLQERDPILNRRIHALASRRQPQRVELLQRWLRDLVQPEEDSVSGSEEDGAVLADAILGFLEAAEVLCVDGEAAKVLEWIEVLLGAAEGLFYRVIDDSGWLVADALTDAGRIWLRAAAMARAQGSEEDWGARLFRLRSEDTFSILDDTLRQASVLLLPPELRRLAGAYEKRALDALAGEGGGYAALYDLGLIAKALRDPELYAHSVTLKSDSLSEAQLEEIAQVYLDLGDPKGALTWLGGSWKAEPTRLSLRAKAFEALDDRQQLMEARRLLWLARPHRETLKAYLRLLSDSEQERVRRAAIKLASESEELESSLDLLLYLGQPEVAESMLLERRERMITSESLATQFEEQDHPLAAVILYRQLLEDIVDAGRSRSYRRAARYYRKLEALAPKISDWRGLDPHGHYLADLWSRHALKSAFWHRVGGRPQGVDPTI